MRKHAALVLALLAVVLSFTGVADAAREAAVKIVSKPRPNAVLKLDKKGKFPAKAIPKVAAAKRADRLGGKSATDLTVSCDPQSVDLGTWCLQAAPYPLPNEDIGKNDFFYATAACVEAGGFLPTAAQLIGAAARVKLASTIDDVPVSSSPDVDATDGLKDRREMSATLVTTQAGSSAAGLARASPRARAATRRRASRTRSRCPPTRHPQSLQYVTVYDNHDKGGFAGSKPVSSPETFRCGFNKAQGTERHRRGVTSQLDHTWFTSRVTGVGARAHEGVSRCTRQSRSRS